MNNNKYVDLTQNQMMRCIICHNETINLEILTLCTKCTRVSLLKTRLVHHINIKELEKNTKYLQKHSPTFMYLNFTFQTITNF